LPKLDLAFWTGAITAWVRKPTRAPEAPQRTFIEARAIGHLSHGQPLDISPQDRHRLSGKEPTAVVPSFQVGNRSPVIDHVSKRSQAVGGCR
jgi:hypothetical protein